MKTKTRVNLRRAFRARRKQLTAVALIAAFALLSIFYNFCLQRGACTGTVEDQWFLIKLTALAVGAVFAIIFFVSVIRARRRNERDRQVEGFAYHPWYYDRRDIFITAQVQKVFRTDLNFIITRKITDIFRTLTKNNDPAGRYIHQRFLIASPMLKPGHQMLVLHNTSYGKLRLREGMWIRIQGQYIHQRGREWGWFGPKLSFYGKLHRTHPPYGRVELLEGRPVLSESDQVQLVDTSSGYGSRGGRPPHGSTT